MAPVPTVESLTAEDILWADTYRPCSQLGYWIRGLHRG